MMVSGLIASLIIAPAWGVLWPGRWLRWSLLPIAIVLVGALGYPLVSASWQHAHPVDDLRSMRCSGTIATIEPRLDGNRSFWTSCGPGGRRWRGP